MNQIYRVLEVELLTLVERGAEMERLTTITCCSNIRTATLMVGNSGTYLRARVLRLFRFKRRTRFFLHLALIFNQVSTVENGKYIP